VIPVHTDNKTTIRAIRRFFGAIVNNLVCYTKSANTLVVVAVGVKSKKVSRNRRTGARFTCSVTSDSGEVTPFAFLFFSSWNLKSQFELHLFWFIILLKS